MYYGDKTEDEFIKDGYLVLTDEEHNILHDNFLNTMCNDWIEITEDQYNDALNCLPPLKWYDGGFFISEMYTSDVSSFYQQLGDRYFTSKQRLSYKREDIIDNLKRFI